MKIKAIFVAVLLLPAVFASGRGNGETRFSDAHFAMGTVCTITLYGRNNPGALQGAFDLIDELESEMSVEMVDSDVAQVNDLAGVAPVQVSSDTFYVVDKSLYYSDISGGKFDITVEPLVKLWGIGTDEARVPSQPEIDAALALIGSKDVVLDKQNSTVYLKRPGMGIDLGAIAKGYAADRVRDYLVEKGVKTGIVSLGGNILMFGEKPGGEPWRIGIQDPYDLRGAALGTVKLPEGTVVTSGIYERYFEENGVRYHHILDTATGYPVDNELASVSIIGQKSIDADAFSTIVFALGIEKGTELVESDPSIEAIFVTKDREIYLTSGLAGLFTLSNADFVVKTE